MCDTMAAVGSATLGGAVLFAKNSDRRFNEAQYLELVLAARHPAGARLRLTYKEIEQAPQTYTVLLSKPWWIWGAEIGANEHGLVIGNEAIISKIEPSLQEGIIGMDYLRLALERARDVDEAIDVISSHLRAHGQSGNCGFDHASAYHNSFLLADPRGAKVLETADREWVVRSVESYYAISNAITIEQTFSASSRTIESRAVEDGFHRSGAPFAFKSVYEDAGKVGSGEYRRARAMSLLGERSGQLQPADLFRILRDHQEGVPQPGRSPPRICAHARESPLGQTTASWVASIEPQRIVHWVTGTSAPCTGLFKPVLLEIGLPEHGPKPGQHEESTSLWWRHEQLRRALEENGPQTRRAYDEERDQIESRFVAEIVACPLVVDEDSRAEARRITEACWQEALAFERRWHQFALRESCGT